LRDHVTEEKGKRRGLASVYPTMGFRRPSLYNGGKGSIIIPVLAAEDMEIVAFHIKWFTMNRGSNNITGASNACPLFSTSAHY